MQRRLEKASRGLPFSAGGLNVFDIRKYFVNQGIPVDPYIIRAKLNEKLKQVLQSHGQEPVQSLMASRTQHASPPANAGASDSETEISFHVFNHSSHRLIINNDISFEPNEQVSFALFDLDDTLTRRGDSKFISNRVKDQLIKLKSSHQIAIISNQYKTSLDKWIEREDLLLEQFAKYDIPVVMAVAFDKDRFRKPNVGLLHEIEKRLHVKIDRDTSFYVGDAAGRPKTGSRKRDFSISDRFLAWNFGIEFYTDTEYFNSKGSKGSKGEPFIDPYNTLELVEPLTPSSAVEDIDAEIDLDRVRMLVLVGPQASGKTTLASFLSETRDFVHLEKDKLKTRMESKVRSELAKGNQVVVDATGGTRSQRAKMIPDTLLDSDVGYIYFDLEKKLAFHLNFLRSSGAGQRQLPNVAINTYYSRLDFDADNHLNTVVINRPVIKEKWQSRYLDYKYPI